MKNLYSAHREESQHPQQHLEIPPDLLSEWIWLDPEAFSVLIVGALARSEGSHVGLPSRPPRALSVSGGGLATLATREEGRKEAVSLQRRRFNSKSHSRAIKKNGTMKISLEKSLCLDISLRRRFVFSFSLWSTLNKGGCVDRG